MCIVRLILSSFLVWEAHIPNDPPILIFMQRLESQNEEIPACKSGGAAKTTRFRV